MLVSFVGPDRRLQEKSERIFGKYQVHDLAIFPIQYQPSVPRASRCDIPM